MVMADVLERYPGARRALFAKYHIGGCASCAFHPEETLAALCARNEGLDVDEVLAHIQKSHERDLERQVGPAELKSSLDAEPGSVALLDVRTREEFESVKLPGADLLTQAKLQEMMGHWAKDRRIVIYDHTGENTSMDAAAYLEGHGFQNVRVLRGGIDAYSAEADASIPRYRVELAEE